MDKKIPEIRFKGFTDDWEERKLKDVVEKQIKGKAQFEKLAPGNVEYLDTARLNGGKSILTNGLKDVMLDDILILWDGSKAGTVYHGFEGALGSTLKAYRTSANSKFIYQYLKRHKDNIYKNYRTPNIPHVQKDFLDVFPISVPKRDEQEKIGSFFQQLDNNITLHQRKLDLLKEQKKGFLQKMFPKAGEKIPELRFKGFTDDWEQRKLGEVTERVRGNDGRMDLPTLTISASLGWLDQRERFSGNIAGKEQKNYTLLKKGELSYNHGNSKLAKYGVVFSLNSFEEALVPRVYHSFKTKKYTSSDFIEYMFATKKPDKELGKLVSSGARMDGLLNINYDEFMGISINLPLFEEQQKISAFFKQLDNTITLHQRKLDLLKKQKKGFLQKMFI